MKIHFIFMFLALLTMAMSCQQADQVGNYYSLSTFEEDAINVVVEIPAGTSHKIEYDPPSNQFFNDQIDGQDRIINFLPYPANYGFIPSTLMDEARGGDGDALDVLLIAESVPTGSVVKARPIGTLRLNDSGELDTKIIAVPVEEAIQLIKADDFVSFMIEYDAAKRIIEEWFLNYKGTGVTQLLGWEDEQYALGEIKKWSLDNKEKK
ncbi:MAG: inorganic diphosphatase [Bacteroidota bacterium]